ncbi:MAG: phosphate ABC transporter substrate-binding/OmpA family protein [Magnetospiraceae bacterium]
MNRSVMGALALLLVGLVVLGGGYVIWPMIQESREIGTSDAAHSKGTLRVGVDNFVGYFPLCSPQMRRLMLADGYKLACVDDQADYQKRFNDLKGGSLEFAVATIDAYLTNGQRSGYPGVIIAVIDQSQGGDAIVGRTEAAQSLNDLKTKPGLKIAFTPDSPSHHLLKAVGVHFDIPLLVGADQSWRVETNGSSEALERLQSGQAQVAAVWEPEVTKALATTGIVKLLGSEQTDKLIVDILLVNRDFIDREPDTVRLLIGNYFKALKHYRDNPDDFADDVADYADVSKDLASSMLAGVRWQTLYENATRWFGISAPGDPAEHGLFEAIEATIQILIDFGDLNGNPLPGQDPRRVTNSDPVAKLFARGVTGGAGANTPQTISENSLERDFPALDAAGWAGLREVGTLKVRPIIFQSGKEALTLAGKEELDKAVAALKSYPNFRVVVEGHTNTRGDAEANQALSQERAEAVGRYLHVTYNIDRDRLRTVGHGGERPLPRKPGEPYRGYMDRLSRVELHLMAEVY